MREHTGPVTSVIPLTNARIASCSTDKTIKVWDTKKNQCIQTLIGHEECVKSCVELPGNLLASYSNDNIICIWDPNKSGKLKYRIDVNNVMRLRHDSEISAHKILDDGRCFCFAQNSIIMMLDLKKYPEGPESTGAIYDLKGHNGIIKSIALMEDGRVVSGSKNFKIKIWDLSNGEAKALRTLTQIFHKHAITTTN